MGKNSILQGAFVLTVSSILVRLLGFAYRIILSRRIGPEGMGILQLIMPVLFTSLALVSAGIPLAVSKLVAHRRALGDFYGIRKVLFTALGLVISLSLLVCFVLVLKVNWIAYGILKEPRVRGGLLAIYPAIIMMSVSAVFKGYFYGVKNFYPPAISEIIEELITIILIFYFLDRTNHLDISVQVTVAALAIVIGELSSLLYLNYSYYRTPKDLPLTRTQATSPHPLMNILKLSGPITLVRLVSSLGTSLSSILIPQRLVASGITQSQAMSTLGILNGMVSPLMFLPFTFVGSLAVVMIPNLSEELARNNWSRVSSKISKAIYTTTIAALPFGALMMALANPIGILLYKQNEVGHLLGILAYFSGINAVSYTLSAILNGLGYQNKSAIFAIIGTGIEIIFIYFLVALPNLRIYGYIIGFFVSSLIVLSLQLITLHKVSRVKILWSEWFLKPTLASLLTASLIRLIYITLFKGIYSLSISFAISIFMGIILYTFILYIMDSTRFFIQSIFHSSI
jgi:stage V sporulation protein B